MMSRSYQITKDPTMLEYRPLLKISAQIPSAEVAMQQG